jgi:isopentenyldiphosphate isomerase
MEYLDVLDGEGNVTGEKVLRTEVHTKGLWHNTVHIYLFRKRNNEIELLVHLRAKTKDLSPNTWDIRFGGHVKAGETIEEAVASEVKEEIGLNVKSEDLIFGGKVIHNGETNKEHISVYFYNFEGDTATLEFNDGEVSEVKWVSTNNIIGESHKNPELWGGKKEEGFKRILDMLSKSIEIGT